VLRWGGGILLRDSKGPGEGSGGENLIMQHQGGIQSGEKPGGTVMSGEGGSEEPI